MKKRTFVAEMAFLKILIKSLNLAENPKKLAENPITSKKLAGRISPDTSLFGCMHVGSYLSLSLTLSLPLSLSVSHLVQRSH